MEARRSSCIRQFLRFFVSMGPGTAAQYAALLFLVWIGVWYVIAVGVGYLCYYTISYKLQKQWVFRDALAEAADTGTYPRTLYAYIVSATLMACANAALVYILVEMFHTWILVAQCIAGTILMLATFLIHRSVVFIRRS